MSLVLDPNNSTIETVNDKIIGEGLHAFEANMPGGAAWTSGLTVELSMQSAYPGDEDEWELLYTFSGKGSFQLYLVDDRKYRVLSSASGPWVKLNLLRSRVTK